MGNARKSVPKAAKPKASVKKPAAKKAAKPSTPAKKVRSSSEVEQRVHIPKVGGSKSPSATKRQGPQPVRARPAKPTKEGSTPSLGSKAKAPEIDNSALVQPIPQFTRIKKAKPKAGKNKPDKGLTSDRLLRAQAVPDPVFKGLRPTMRAFADEYLRDLNGTAAYLRIHPTAGARTATVNASRMLTQADVKEYIAAKRQRIQISIDYTREDWLRDQLEIALADPAELMQLRQVSCDSCWPIELDAKKKAVTPGIWTEPNPDCLDCAGEGLPRPWFADTRRLSPGARKLFTGVHKGKDGLRILTHDQGAARERIGRALGVFAKDNEQKTGPLAEAVRDFFAGLHGTARLPIARPEPKASASIGNRLVRD